MRDTLTLPSKPLVSAPEEWLPWQDELASDAGAGMGAAATNTPTPDSATALLSPPEATPDPAEAIEGMDADEVLEVMAAERARIARATARMHRALARLAVVRDAQGYEIGRHTPEEVAVVLACSPRSASARVAEAEHLTEHLPGTLAALQRGAIDGQQAHAIAEPTARLAPDLLRALETRILPRVAHWTPGRIRERIRYHLARLDPEGTRERQRDRQQDRGVSYTDHGDGMATLGAHLPAEHAYRIYRHLCEHATRIHSADDARTADQRRADVLIDLLLGNDREHVHTEVHVQVPASVLTGATHEPGELLGTGYLDPDTVRALATGNATWRRILTDPADDTVLSVGRRRYPSPALARHVRARDKRCRFPGCPRAAHACHLDHTRPYADGGNTEPGNLGALCPRHNQMKEHTRWNLAQPHPGEFAWTSPTNTTHTVTPDDDPPPF